MSIISLFIEECMCGCKGPLTVGLLWAVNKAEMEAAGHWFVITVIPHRMWRQSFVEPKRIYRDDI